MRNGMRSIHVVWGGWALGIRAGNWPSNHPTQWLDSAPCAAYFACHAKKSYFPGLNTEMDLACYSHFLTFIPQHRSASCCTLWSSKSLHQRKNIFLKFDRCHVHSRRLLFITSVWAL